MAGIESWEGVSLILIAMLDSDIEICTQRLAQATSRLEELYQQRAAAQQTIDLIRSRPHDANSAVSQTPAAPLEAPAPRLEA